MLRCGDGPGSAEPSRRSCARVRTNRWPRPRAARGRQSWGETEINTRNIAGGTCPETVRNLPCTPATELGRLGALNAGGRLELLRVVTQLLRVVTQLLRSYGWTPIQRARPRVMPPCPHGRQRSLCKDCGGKGICEHGGNKYTCKECGGSSICEHGRQRKTCKECGGSSLCEHGRERRRCKECSGTGSDHVTSPTPFWQPRASAASCFAPAASCSAARYLYGAFVVAAAASGRRQLPLAPGGELAMDFGCTLIFMPPNSNSNSREP